jgi:hypothetical protein
MHEVASIFNAERKNLFCCFKNILTKFIKNPQHNPPCMTGMNVRRGKGITIPLRPFREAPPFKAVRFTQVNYQASFRSPCQQPHNIPVMSLQHYSWADISQSIVSLQFALHYVDSRQNSRKWPGPSLPDRQDSQ